MTRYVNWCNVVTRNDGVTSISPYLFQAEKMSIELNSQSYKCTRFVHFKYQQ